MKVFFALCFCLTIHLAFGLNKRIAYNRFLDEVAQRRLYRRNDTCRDEIRNGRYWKCDADDKSCTYERYCPKIVEETITCDDGTKKKIKKETGGTWVKIDGNCKRVPHCTCLSLTQSESCEQIKPEDLCPPPARTDPDPHFRTYQGHYYDYHGGCDLVLVQSQLIDIHIRTEVRTTSSGRVWSGITGFALRVGEDIFEIKADPFQVFYNRENVEYNSDLLAQLAQRYRFFVDRPRFYLTGDQYIEVRRLGETDPTFSIIFSAHRSTILDAVGMYGTRSDTENGMLGRDGMTRYDRDTADKFGEDWQVDPKKGDPQLFNDPGVPTCTYSRRVLTDEETEVELLTMAEEACEFLYFIDENKYENCVFDVVITGDVTWAKAPVYAEEEPKYEFAGQCVPVGNECEQEGGECLWRCNSNENTCISSMCKGQSGFDEYAGEELQGGFVDGCSCALPLNYVQPQSGDEGCGLSGIGRMLGLCFILEFFQNFLKSFLSLV